MPNKDFTKDTKDTATSSDNNKGSTFGAPSSPAEVSKKDETKIGPGSGPGFRTVT